MSHKKVYDYISIPIDLSVILTEKNTQKVWVMGAGGDFKDRIKTGNEAEVRISSAPITNVIKGINITGINYIDESLHIQTTVKGKLEYDPHGFFYLTDSDGNTIDSNYTFSFYNEKDATERIDYEEYVFDIPKKDIADYALYGYFVESGMRTEGNWSVTFPLEYHK